MDLEDTMGTPGAIVRDTAADAKRNCVLGAPGGISSLEEVSELRMSDEKAAAIAVAEVMIDRQYRNQKVEINELELKQIATLAVEVGGSHALDMFGSAKFTAEAPKWGVRPAFVTDLSEKKPFGPNKGKYWDLTSKEDIDELKEMQSYEKPTLLTGGPPCNTFSLLQGASAEEDESKMRAARKLLHVAVQSYRRQHEEGRWFLHEHPEGASSWCDPEIIALQQSPGVSTVCGPMCSWDMELDDGTQQTTRVYKRTKWLTNSRRLASLLDRWCSDQLGNGYHVHVHLVGGLAAQAAQYSPKLVAEVLREVKDHLCETRELSQIQAFASGPDPNQEQWAEWSDETWDDVAKFFDNISGAALPTDKVLEARAEELKWCDHIALYTKVLRNVATNRGIKPVPTGWVDVNKGDAIKMNIRSRLVGKELKAKTKDQLLAHELFSPMPPWEMIKVILGFLVTDNFDEIDADDLCVGIFDISRAHFMAPAERELYIELPDEAKSPDDGDVVGRLNRMMYGFRDASNGWARDWQALLKDNGYAVGMANAALFYNRSAKARGGVHGDDFYVLGPRKAIDGMGDILKSKYSLRESSRLGFGRGCHRTATILNRVVTLSIDSDGRKAVTIEPDARHVEIVLRSLGLAGKETKSVSTLGVKKTDAQEERKLGEPPIGRNETTMFRSCLMRTSFLAQDRADLPEAVKCLAQQMSSPTRSSMEELKHLARYLKGKPSVALVLRQQRMPKTIRMSVDSDFAADRRTRRSTTGMVQRLGTHCVKATSNLQASARLNVGETEYYALVHGAVHGLGLQSYLKDLGLHLDLVIESDSTSAKSFASRQGLGKQRYVQTRYLWVQERIARKEFAIQKVESGKNVSDILTKDTASPLLLRHMEKLGQELVVPSPLHKRVA